MYLKPIEPFREFDRLRRQMDSMFAFDDFERPRIDVIETENEVKVKAEIPGISKDDLDIVVYDEEVRISGEFKKSDEYKDENLRRVERYYGSFSRIVPLPSEVKSDEAKAEYKDGILTLSIPKSDRHTSKGKRIKLQWGLIPSLLFIHYFLLLNNMILWYNLKYKWKIILHLKIK